jgi:uncharacterized membrane protein YeiH
VANSERLKAEISFREKLLIFALAMIAAMSGWIATNFDKTETWALILGLFATVILTACSVYQHWRVGKLLENFDDY